MKHKNNLNNLFIGCLILGLLLLSGCGSADTVTGLQAGTDSETLSSQQIAPETDADSGQPASDPSAAVGGKAAGLSDGDTLNAQTAADTRDSTVSSDRVLDEFTAGFAGEMIAALDEDLQVSPATPETTEGPEVPYLSESDSFDKKTDSRTDTTNYLPEENDSARAEANSPESSRETSSDIAKESRDSFDQLKTKYGNREFTGYTLSAPEKAILTGNQLTASSADNADSDADNNSTGYADTQNAANRESASLLSPAPEDISVTYYKSSYLRSSYDDVFLSFEGDEAVLNIPYDISDHATRNAFLSFDSETCECTLIAPESTYIIPGSSASENRIMGMDLTLDAKLQIQGEHFNRQYPLTIKRTVHDIPVLYLRTDSGEDVTDRYEYVPGSVTIDNSCEMVVSNGSNYAKNHEGTYYENTYKRQQDKNAAKALDKVTLDMNIRGRGNASWWKFEQKSYMLKFDKAVSLFGMTNADKYALVSTYGDPSLIRNCVAMDIATCMDSLEYTTGQIPVDVFLNGTYLGVYTLSEKIDTAPDKIDLFSGTSYAGIKMNGITDIPFMVECGAYVKDTYTYGLDYFYTPHSPQLFVKYPEITEQYNEEITYITDTMTKADQAMTRGYGYEEYIDVDSWVDWFVVMELTNNTDSALCRSTYLYKRADGKLMIGPVWDFDMAFGNYAYDNQTYEYWATAEPIFISAQNHYMSYLYKSDSFMLAVRERWDEKKEELLEAAMKAVDKYADQVAESRIYNNHVRGSGGTSYQVEAIRNFIKHRYNWIDMSIHMSDFNRQEPPESVPVFEPEEIPLLEVDENAAPDELQAEGAASEGETAQGVPMDGLPADGAANPAEPAQETPADGNNTGDNTRE